MTLECGPYWVDFLTTTCNESYIQTYNLAFGDAIIDSALIKSYMPTALSVKQQVQDEYLPIYVSKPEFTPLSSNNSLFSMFITINDVGNSYSAKNASLYDIITNEYAGLLYQSRARNFLFLPVPPVWRSPLTIAAGASYQRADKEAIFS
ncbi:carbohydrate esterase family 16 protein [Lepidopterella palustris CBS 459.81]|uniref:Carbohydrate esterase family 16 protein n=1 Tax=Lepidopterella palustris CBS 459.81 TaxID=1314670 RepID=A0A8E2E5B0_9PEZI|nr:carbohydrate esterase family 16 protein [Lepidopterella palustris CBS 459.81]